MDMVNPNFPQAFINRNDNKVSNVVLLQRVSLTFKGSKDGFLTFSIHFMSLTIKNVLLVEIND